MTYSVFYFCNKFTAPQNFNKMNQFSRQHLLIRRIKQLGRQIESVRLCSGEERDKDKEKKPPPPGEAPPTPVNREKGVSSKKESVREESYFHKEEVKQLKDLKKKIKEENKPENK